MLYRTSYSSFVSSFDVKTSMFISISLTWLLSSPLIYIIGKILFNDKVVLSGVLVYLISDYAIHEGIQGLGWTFALPLYVLFIYYLLNNSVNSKKMFTLIFIYTAVLFTHPTSQIILLSIILGSTVLNYTLKINKNTHFFLLSVICMLLSVIHTTYTLYMSRFNETTFLHTLIVNLKSVIYSTQMPSTIYLSNNDVSISIYILIFNRLGYGFLLFR